MRINSVIPSAVAHIKGEGITGRVDFFQRKDAVLVKASVSGLPENEMGFFGFHIHEGESCLGENFSATGSHYDKNKKEHPKHSGDMPPLFSNGKNAYLAFLTNRFSVADVLGKTVVIHDKADDFTTQPAGNAGTKIACGVIEKA